MMRKLVPFATLVTAYLVVPAAFGQEAQAKSQPIAPANLAGAIAWAVLAIGIVWFIARRTTLLRDNMLPQIAPRQQTYSLGRWQMAFWTVLILGSFVAIYVLRGQYDGIVSTQAVWLMGISAGSGVAAMAVDAARDSPADAANRGLIALGLRTYEDVVRVHEEIAERQKLLSAVPTPANAAQLAIEINDRQLLLTAYNNAIKPFVSEGWFKDLVTDLDGAALHRLQTLAWTIVLGIVFVVEVIRYQVMPQFDATLLVLLGISNGGYVGFKYPEPQ